MGLFNRIVESRVARFTGRIDVCSRIKKKLHSSHISTNGSDVQWGVTDPTASVRSNRRGILEPGSNAFKAIQKIS